MKSECGHYRGISLISLGKKLIRMIVLNRLRDVEDKIIKMNSVILGRGEDASIQFSLLD